jgi:hypothetical protein
MHIGILTFHRANNYGAVLQAYALKTYLSDRGHDVGFIDFQHQNVQIIHRLVPPLRLLKPRTTLKNLYSMFLNFRGRIDHIRVFNLFRKKYFTNISLDKNVELDLIILGGDQIWNPEFMNGIPPEHTGDFKNINFRKISSFSASAGSLDRSSTELFDLPFRLAELSAIGVRERSLAEFLLKMNPSLKPVVTIDPVFLLEKKRWSQLALPRSEKKEYILYYEVEANYKTEAILRELRRKTGLEVKRICATRPPSKPFLGRGGVSPEEFLGIFLNSKYIVTTSFHGTAFSLIFEKEFYTVKAGTSSDSRSAELLEEIGLSDRLISKADQLKLEEPLDFQLAKQKLCEKKNKSQEFLESLV